MKKAYIKHITFHVPDQILTNDDLSQMMDTSDEWISTRTGIKKRHIVGDSGAVSYTHLTLPTICSV